MYFVYIIECRDGTLYTGSTTNIQRRFAQHAAGKGARYTRAKQAKKLVYSESLANRSAALKREAEIKRWRRNKKLQLIKMQAV